MRIVWIVLLAVAAAGCEDERCNGVCSQCPTPPVGHYCTGSEGDQCFYCPFGSSCQDGKCVSYTEDDGDPATPREVVPVELGACAEAAP
jgi:hypothetical protein